MLQPHATLPAVLLGALFAAHCLAGPGDIRTQLISGHGDVPLNVVQAGNPQHRSIIFIHGLGQSHLSWMRQLGSDLADNFHLVAYDLRGHGNSGKPWRAEDYAAPDTWAKDLTQVMRATGAENPLVVAWSYGTFVAVDYLASGGTAPIAGLVMVGGLGGLSRPTSTPGQADAERGKRISDRRQSELLSENFAAGDEIMRFFMRGEITDRRWMRDNAAANALLPPYARPLIVQRSFDHSDEIPRVDIPTLLVVGSEDPLLTPEDANALSARLPQASVSVFDGSGHLPFAESPDRFNAELTVFANRVFDDGRTE
ncbi:MAG: alpha/beta hydrolase [Chromatocurvus sp.]